MSMLGPFELEKVIGRGGMGEVWSGRHVEQGVQVAIKVLTAKVASEAQFVRAFRDEVQAVARLSHPGIILVLDHGKVSPEAQAATGGQLIAGHPYLAMEMCSQGALDELGRSLTWFELKGVLMSLLEALGHAHARGVIHKDLKPPNVMLGSDIPSRPGLKLTDFGIAHAMQGKERTGSVEKSMGTPHYMAPEQVEGHWRDYGPWTDLYALGCMAWELATGALAFDGKSYWEIALKHMRAPLPTLKARIAVPDDFEAWIRTLMAKSPRKRFQQAADAAFALDQLGDPPEVAFDMSSHRTATGRWVLDLRQGTSPPDLEINSDTVADGLDLDTMVNSDTLDFAPAATTAEQDADRPSITWPRPPLPLTWRRKDAHTTSMKLVGAGLGLYGLRTIPMVGRNKERERIWEALGQVHRTRQAGALLLQGAGGVGTSRLVEWMCERALEVGAATVLKMSHGPRAAPTEALARMVASHLRCQGLESRDEVRLRIQSFLQGREVDDDYEWNALTELIAPADEAGEVPTVSLTTPRSRYVLVARLLEREALERPLIVWMDDVQWGSDALAFTEFMMLRQTRVARPILMLLTVNNEALTERPEESVQINALVATEGVDATHVGPLEVADREALVRELLGLGGELAQRVEERCGGNPLFAVQLIGDWVQRGVLEVGPTGFVLRQGERAHLPDSLHQVWAARLQRLLSAQSSDALQALELAAALGHRVNLDEWIEACRRQQLTPPDLQTTLVAHRLAEASPEGWSFTQTMFRESLERMARDQGRWATHNRVCAEMLVMSPHKPSDRLGRHLLEAGAPAAAFNHLSQAVAEELDGGNYRAAAALLRLQETSLRAVGADDDDLRWAQIWAQRARIHVQRGNPTDAVTWATQARNLAETKAAQELLCEALLCLAHATRGLGRPEEARALYLQTMMVYHNAGDTGGRADCLRALGQMRGSRDSREQRIAWFEEALVIYRRLDNQLGVADCLRGLSQHVQAQGDLERAGRLTTMAMEAFEALGNQLGLAHCFNARAELARYKGDLDNAETDYRRALALYESVGAGATTLPRLNLALVLLARGRYEESRRLFEAIREVLEQAGRKVFLGAVHANILPTTAAARDWPAFDRHCDQALTILSETNLHDPDIAWPAQLAGDLARDAGDPLRARRAYALALSQWEALGIKSRGAETRAAMDALE